jgi:hypothetical protein
MRQVDKPAEPLGPVGGGTPPPLALKDCLDY